MNVVAVIHELCLPLSERLSELLLSENIMKFRALSFFLIGSNLKIQIMCALIHVIIKAMKTGKLRMTKNWPGTAIVILYTLAT